MLSAFEQAEFRGQIALESGFGKTITYIPMRTLPDERPIPDQSRPTLYNVPCVMNRKPVGKSYKGIDFRRDNTRGERYSQPSEFIVEMEIRGCLLPYEPLQYDVIEGFGTRWEVCDLTTYGNVVWSIPVKEKGFGHAAKV
jgi:hypothetical protein